MNLLNHIKIYNPVGSTIGGGTVGSTFIDMQGYGGCLFLLTMTASGVASTGTLIIQQSSGASTAGAYSAKFASSDKVKFTAGLPLKAMAIDVVKPLKRYVRLRTLTCTGVQITAIAYNARRMGSTQALQYSHTSDRKSGVHICST